MKRFTTLIVAVAALGLAGLGSLADARAPAGAGHWQLSEGFILHAEDRFDPLIQRILAEQSLKALPLRGGQLFYIVPANVDPRHEQMQIRYLEMLLDKQALEPAAVTP